MFRKVCHGLRWLRQKARDERGATLVLVASSMLALTSIMALAIDVGRLTAARTEAQRVADLAALAGAGGLLQSPGNEPLARFLALDYAARNRIQGDQAVVLPEDVEVDTDDSQVTVTVFRVEDRGNPVPTFFARIFGVDAVDVAARATAEAAPAGGINCLLPIALPDRWYEAGGPGNTPQSFDPEDGDYYIPWAEPGSDPVIYNEDFTGYSERDRGSVVSLTSNDARGGINSSWYYPWRPWDQQGAEDYRTNVWSCVDPSLVFGVGAQVDTEPGNMAGPTMQGFKDLIEKDPSASWNSIQNCVVDRGLEFSVDATHCRSSPRIRPIPMFDPRDEPDLGSKPFTFTNFAGIFVEGIEGKTVYARWIGYTALNPASPKDGITNPLFKVLRLVE